jgi:hypothetical protein
MPNGWHPDTERPEPGPDRRGDETKSPRESPREKPERKEPPPKKEK